MLIRLWYSGGNDTSALYCVNIENMLCGCADTAMSLLALRLLLPGPQCDGSACTAIGPQCDGSACTAVGPQCDVPACTPIVTGERARRLHSTGPFVCQRSKRFVRKSHTPLVENMDSLDTGQKKSMS